MEITGGKVKMAVTYWTGENLTLRAIQPEDIVIFDSLDDEILRNSQRFQLYLLYYYHYQLQ